MKKLYSGRLIYFLFVFGLLFVIQFQAKACDANFSYSVNHTTKTVTFSNTSTGLGLSYLWKFGDNTTSTTLNPSKVYTNAGTYNVCLYIHDSGYLCVDSFCTSIVVGSSCNAAFTNIADTLNFKKIYFTSSNTASNLTHLWNFGDSTANSTAQHPNHTYVNAGTYYVCHTVSKAYNGDTCSVTSCHNVLVAYPGTCDAAFSYGINNTTKTITFTNLSIGTGLNYYWKFGDNTTSSLSNPVKTYANYGSYNICLYVYNSTGCLDSICSIATLIQPATCVSNFSFTINPNNSKSVYFIGSATGSNLIYTWNFGDSSAASHSVNTTHLYNSTGTYLVCLKVVNSQDTTCNSTKCMAVNIVDSNSCTPNFSYLADSANYLKYYFTPALANSSNASFAWNFGDSSTSTVYNPNHIFKAGTYNVCLKTTKIVGTDTCRNQKCTLITVGCKAEFTMTMSASNPRTFNFNGSGSSGASLKYFWNYGNGITYNSGTTNNVNYTFPSTGTYTVCLTVKSTIDTTCANAKCATLLVNDSLACGAYYTSAADSSNNHKIYFKPYLNYYPNTTYFWTFGDSSTATGYNVNHIFQNGTFNVCLKTTRIYGTDTCIRQICNNINVGCRADFTFAADPGNSLKINFTNASPGSNLTYLWSFGSGPNSTLKNPSKTYDSAGTYTVCLVVHSTTDTTCNNTKCKTVVVTKPVNCLAKFLFVKDTLNTNKVFFINQSEGDSLSFYWNFGDSSTYSNAKNPDHTYAHTGYHRVCLYISGKNCNTSHCDTVYTGSGTGSCVANFGFSVNSGTYGVNFVNQSSGSGLRALWSFGDSTVSSNYNTFHLYPAPGVYNACLYVSDSMNSNCNSVKCKLVNIPSNQVFCSANFTASKDTSYHLGHKVNFMAATSYTDSTTAFLWTFGDGDSAMTKNPAHVYAVSSSYSVCLNISNPGDSCFLTFCQLVKIDSLTGMKEQFNSIRQAVIYPNPFDDKLNIDLDIKNAGKVLISIFDIQGREYYSGQFDLSSSKNHISLETGEIPKGVYVVRLTQNGDSLIKKLIK